MGIMVAVSESSMSAASYRKYLFAYAWQSVYIVSVGLAYSHSLTEERS